MRNLIAFALAFCWAELLGQKIDGVYYGDIVSPKNTMIIKSNGEQANGIIYLNEKDTLHFSGMFSEVDFKATIFLKDKQKIELAGAIEENAMWLQVSPDPDRRFLNKVSGKTNYKVKKLYAEDMDARLLGRWETVSDVDKNGIASSNGKVAMTYFDNHRMISQILVIPAGINVSNQFVSNAQILSQRLEHTWTANGYQQTVTVVLPNVNPALLARVGSPPPRTAVYVITHDTLISYAGSGAYSVFKKK